MTATYTTPEISFQGFAEYNPGHGLDTVAATRRWIAGEFEATVRVIETEGGVQFKVTGPADHINSFAALYGN